MFIKPIPAGGNILVEMVKEALENINLEYVKLSRLAYDRNAREHPVFQEKPFAYEFYHQYRKLYENNFDDTVIQAEVNKSSQGYPNCQKMPDFILHNPDSRRNNLGVIEFKRAYVSGQSNAPSIRKDFDKLVNFKKPPLKYKTVIEVIIGTEDEINRLKRLIRSKEDGESIWILWFNIDHLDAEKDEIFW